MKRRLLFLLALIAVNAAPIAESIAKPAYCGVALVRCVNHCGDSMWGSFCDVGCLIGYYRC